MTLDLAHLPAPRHGARLRARHLLAALAVLAALVVTVVAGIGAADATDRAPRAGTPSERPIIVEVTGDAANGFGVHYADGSEIFPPTDSESIAECSEYDRRLDRVRCRVEVRIWYRDLGDLQRSLAYVRAGG
ncbi:hypothetical protein [Nocardioides sp. R-C-SC26]|uniref:hypothetical protein n=1 Tax=Nocardioides sp. R-C-SC26 TaxID=2870414 RepID=UPI001E4F4AFC|nr:hypothetical protein [Nocardioides sp. R-C-SC26]